MNIERSILILDAIARSKDYVLRGWSRSDAVAAASDDYGLEQDEADEVADYIKKYGVI